MSRLGQILPQKIQVRLPRAIMAAMVGAGLSMSGASFQGMFQNPLVSPFILGVSAGASFGAALGLVMDLPYMGVQALAYSDHAGRL